MERQKSPEPAAGEEEKLTEKVDAEETISSIRMPGGTATALTQRHISRSDLEDIGSASSRSLELSSQRDLLAAIELHTLDTVWHYLIPLTQNMLCARICRTKKLKKTAVDGFIRFIYHKCHLCALATSTTLYVVWVLSSAYELNHIGTTFVYWWFILELTALLYTANCRMFKEFLFDFTFWYKTISITIGVLCRQLVIDGTSRFTASPWHMISGISFILSYFVASQVVAGLKAFHWPYYLTLIFILLTTVLNAVQIWQIYKSDHDFELQLLGHTMSLRSVAMSSLGNATVFFLQQLFKDTFHRNTMLQRVRMQWVVDQSSHEIFYSGIYNFTKTKSESKIMCMRRSKRTPN